MVTGLITLAAEAAVIGVIAGVLLAWGLSGGDGVDGHPVAALLGLVLFIGTIATTGVVIGLLEGWTGAAVLATVVAVGSGAIAWLSWQPAERDRRPLYATLAGVAFLLPVVMGFLGTADAAAPRHLVIAAVAPVALLLALAPPWGDGAARRDPLMLAALLTLAAPLCLLATTLVA
jgi:hypothetical protein